MEDAIYDPDDGTYIISDNFIDDDGIACEISTGSTIDVGGNGSNVSTSGKIKIDSQPPTGSITIGPSEEVQEAAEKQREKLEELKNVLIDYLGDNRVTEGEKECWKSDYDEIQDFIDQLSPSEFSYLCKNDILSPDDLERLNEIYKNWT